MKQVHAELMALYAQDAMETDKPWERWEWRYPNFGWSQCGTDGPAWTFDIQYRRKPRTIKVNGFDVPEPIRDPEEGASCWAPEVTSIEFAHEFDFISGSAWRVACRDRGLIHSTKEAAVKHAMAMCGIDPATYKEEQ
jgi:hypothetical protein